MANRVQLDNVRHQSLRFARRYGPKLGHGVNQLLVVPTEFEAVQREYPILFRRDPGGGFQAVALLGFDRQENLFLGEGGTWDADYIPALVRREPLLLGEEEGTADPRLSVFIDLDDPRVGEDAGERLYKPHGGTAPALEEAMGALGMVHDGVALASAMFETFVQLGLVQPLSLEVKLADGLEYRIADVFTVGAEQLRLLDSAALDRLHKSGFLAHAIFARSSLANMDRLARHKAEKIANG